MNYKTQQYVQTYWTLYTFSCLFARRCGERRPMCSPRMTTIWRCKFLARSHKSFAWNSHFIWGAYLLRLHSMPMRFISGKCMNSVCLNVTDIQFRGTCKGSQACLCSCIALLHNFCTSAMTSRFPVAKHCGMLCWTNQGNRSLVGHHYWPHAMAGLLVTQGMAALHSNQAFFPMISRYTLNG